MMMMIKKRLVGIAVIAFILMSWVGITFAANLLNNPGFEEIKSGNLPAKWICDIFAGNERNTISLDKEDKYEGKVSARITQKYKDSYSVIYQKVTVKPDTWYLFTGYAKRVLKDVRPGWEPAKFFIGDEKSNYVIDKPILSEEWQKITISFNSGDRKLLHVYGYLYLGAGTVWFDNICLEETDGPFVEEELVLPFQIPQYTDANGNLLVDGQSFFPFGLYDIANIDMLKENAAAGINTAELDISAVTEEFMIAAEELKMKVIICFGDRDLDTVKAIVMRWKDYPALIGWYIYDEPDLRGIDRKEFFAIYQAVKEIDPAHLVTTSFGAPPRFRDFVDGVDVIMPDPYPVPTSPLVKVFSACKSANEAIADSPAKTLFATLQAWERADRRAPSGLELRAMTYLALVGGAKGILYYSYGAAVVKNTDFGNIPYPLSESLPELWDCVKQVAHEIKQIEQVLALPPGNIRITDDEAIAYQIKQAGRTNYIIAVNSTEKASAFKLELPLQSKEIIDLLNTEAKYQVEKKELTDNIEGYGTRVYRITF